MGTLWVVIVAGHIYVAPYTGETDYSNPRTCMSVASAVGGQCIRKPVAAPPSTTDSGTRAVSAAR